jgi:putative NADH-flavin reductase
MTNVELKIEEEVHDSPDGDLNGYFKVKEATGNRLRLVGWAFAEGTSVSAIEVRANQRTVAEAVPRIRRDDVANLYAGVDSAATSGFEVIIEAHGSGRSDLDVEALLADGERKALGRITVVVRARKPSGELR